MMKVKKNSITYAITVCDEYDEIQRLLSYLLSKKREEDDIVVLVDLNKHISEYSHLPFSPLLDYLYKLSSNEYITLIEGYFSQDFGKWKNMLFNHCRGEYVFFIDADELPSDGLMENLPIILENYPEIDVLYVPRVNTVVNIGLSHVKMWGWRISKLEEFKDKRKLNLEDPEQKDIYDLLKTYNLIISNSEEEIEYYMPIINWPDHQSRIAKNNTNIRWSGKVHEKLEGNHEYLISALPEDINLSLLHPKTIERQIKQNNLYDNLM
jgi:hypothetical protein